jgi:hypothetical protein
MENILECMLTCLETNASLISKVLVATKTSDDITRVVKNRDKFPVEFIPFDWILPDPDYAGGYCHGIGLHKCLEFVKTEYVMFIEPDVAIYLKDFDKFYLDCYEKYNLGIVGVTRIADPRGYPFYKLTCFGDFPGIVCTLIKTSALPPKDWLKGHLKLRPNVVDHNDPADNYIKVDGMWLLQTPMPEYKNQFPNPKGVFDPGCNLYLWFKHQHWMSFHLKDHQKPNPLCNATTYNLNNFGLSSDEFGNKPLLFHSGHGNAADLFRAAELATNKTIPIKKNLCNCAVCVAKNRNQ